MELLEQSAESGFGASPMNRPHAVSEPSERRGIMAEGILTITEDADDVTPMKVYSTC
jgi:hypothetical protein